MAKKKSKTQKLKKSIKKNSKTTKKVIAKKPLEQKVTKKTPEKKTVEVQKPIKKTPEVKNKKEEPIVLPKKKTTKRKIVSSNKVKYKIYEEEKKKIQAKKAPAKKTPPKKQEVKKVAPKKVEKPKLEAKEVDITKIEEIDLEKTVNIIIPKEEIEKKGTLAPKEKVKSKLFDRLFAKKKDKKSKKTIVTTNQKNINDLKKLFGSQPPRAAKKETKFALFIASLKNKFKKRKDKEPKVKKQEKIIEGTEEVEEEIKEKRIPKNPILRVLYEIYHYSFIFFNVLIIATFILLIVGLKRVEVIPNKTIIYIACVFLFLGTVAVSYNKYISGKLFTLFLVGIMGVGIYLLQYNFDFLNNLNTKEYEYKEYNVVSFDNAYNKSIYNINNKKVCLLNSNAKNEERVLNLKLDDVEYLTYDTQDEMFEDFYAGKCRAVILTSNQIKYLTNNKENQKQNIKILYTFKANGHK